MASWGITTNDPLTQKAWEEKVFRDVRKDLFIEKFMGQDSNSLVQEKTNLEGIQGDKITFGLITRLNTQPILGSSGISAEGNEDRLSHYDFSVTLEEYKIPIRAKLGLDEKRAMFDISSESEAALKVRASEIMDELYFNAMVASPTKIFYGHGKANADAIDNSDKLDTIIPARVRAYGKIGGGRQTIPIRPVRINGRDYTILVVHPYCLYDLKQDPTFQAWMRDALNRGNENPLFQGATAITVDGVVIHENENIPIAVNSSGVKYAKCFYAGAQSGVWAWGTRGTVVQKEFGYGEERGWCYKFIAAVGKPQFNGQDYGSYGVYVAVTDLSA